MLLAKYGVNRVLESIAKRRDMSVEEIERELRRLEETRKKSRTSHRKTAKEIVDKAKVENPEKRQILVSLASRFDNKTFLPELRDARRLLERFNSNQKSLKSRADAAPLVFRLLARLPIADIREIASDFDSSGESTYSKLAAAIMGHGSG